MNNLLMILAILVVALVVVVPLIERFGSEPNEEKTQGLARWIIPLLLITMVVQALLHFFG